MIGKFWPVKLTEAELITVSGAASTKLGTVIKSLPACVPETAMEEDEDGVELVAFDLETLSWLIIDGRFDLRRVV